MTGRIDVYVARTADGERMTGWCGKRVPSCKSVDVRTFFDPEADRNLSNAVPAPTAKQFDPRVAPRAWTLRSALPDVPEQPREAPGEHCGKRFRTATGIEWHMTNIHGAAS